MLTVTDMFCGAGGSSIGATDVPGIDLRMGLNHWTRAIETHATNFPQAGHDCTDVSATNPRRYPHTDILIASPECTNHSLAKGAQRKGLSQYDAFTAVTHDPAAERSRATMWDVPRFAEVHKYKIIIVENVVDARMWILWDAWLLAMHALGYDHRCVYLNSMFAHPTPQSRDRMYVVFWRRGNKAPDLNICPPAWCHACERNIEAVQSWKANRSAGRYNRQYVYCCPSCASPVTPYYYCALNAIDWSISAERIGDRKKPLKDRTLERIRYGLDKYGRQPLQIITNMTTDGGRVRALYEPLHTQTGSMLAAMVSPFLLRPRGERDPYPSTDPIGSICTNDRGIGVVFPFLVQTRQGSGLECRVKSSTDPMGTQTGDGDRAVVFPAAFQMTYRNYEGVGYPVAPLTDPLTTFVGNGQQRIVINPAALMTMRDQPNFVFAQLGDALHTQVASASQTAVISRQPFLVSYYGQDQASAVTEPMGTLSTRDRHALVQPQEEQKVEDCYFRMLKPPEIGAGMAFPGSYIVTGNVSEQVKQYGNAVTPPAMRVLIERCAASLS